VANLVPLFITDARVSAKLARGAGEETSGPPSGNWLISRCVGVNVGIWAPSARPVPGHASPQEVPLIALRTVLAQAAVEYGAMAGEAAGGAATGGFNDLLSQGRTLATESPLAVALFVLTALVIAGLVRTRRYRL
jgi:hypothetical protein